MGKAGEFPRTPELQKLQPPGNRCVNGFVLI